MVITALQFLLLLGVGFGGYRIRKASEMDLFGTLVAEFCAFSFFMWIVMATDSNFRRPLIIGIACLIGTIFAELLTKKK